MKNSQDTLNTILAGERMTLKDAIEKAMQKYGKQCFEAARTTKYGNSGTLIYDSYEDYKNSLNEKK
jgi:hypothetical protein